MTALTPMQRDAVLAPFLALAPALRRAGFAASPDQAQGFVAAVGLLGPRGLGDVHAAGLALFAIPPERRAEYDAIFAALFEGRTVAADAEGDEEADAVEPEDGEADAPLDDGEETSGDEASVADRLADRDVAQSTPSVLDRFARQAPARLPRRLSYRRAPDRRGDRIDLRRALRQAARNDGEVLRLPRTRRRTRQRRIVCLIDVSGSMRDRSDELLAFAHALVRAGNRVEAFTLGTRLTRITRPLTLRDRNAALARVSQAVADLDGGTRIGEALQAFLAVPRYAGFARGALVVVLSDGLERGDAGAMVDATAKLSRLAWRLHWLSPLAADPDYAPRTAAMAGVLPWLDALGDGGGVPAICDHLLNVARTA